KEKKYEFPLAFLGKVLFRKKQKQKQKMKIQLQSIMSCVIAIVLLATPVFAETAEEACVRISPSCQSEGTYSNCARCSQAYDCSIQCGCPFAGNPAQCIVAATAGLAACKLTYQCS